MLFIRAELNQNGKVGSAIIKSKYVIFLEQGQYSEKLNEKLKIVPLEKRKDPDSDAKPSSSVEGSGKSQAKRQRR